MGKTDPDNVTGGRKRQLNVIYFIDSARTRSFVISLGRLNVVLVLLAGTVAWAIVSVALLVGMSRDKENLAGQLRTALTTVFDYEVKHDGVYDVAYPPADKVGAARRVAAQAPDPKPEPVAAPAHEMVTAPSPVQSATEVAAVVPTPEVKAKDEPSSASEGASTSAADDAGVTVGNPVLEAGGESLELRFDLTTKANHERAEGYVWAVAEFTGDDGKKAYIGAPSSISVRDDGEPTYPQRSAIFGIKRFKKKIFSFPMLDGRSGSFTGVRIGVMDRNGGNKTTYNVPVSIRVGKGTSSGGNSGTGGEGSGSADKAVGPKSG